MVKDTRVTLRLPPKIYRYLKTESETTNVSLNGSICNILARYFGLTSEKWNKYADNNPKPKGENKTKSGEGRIEN